MTRLAPLILVVLALLAGAASPRGQASHTQPAQAAKAFPPVLGIRYRPAGPLLAWFDPLTLRTLPGRKAPLGRDLGSWAFTADRDLLAVGQCGSANSVHLRLVNARAMRVLGDVRVAGSADCVSGVTWIRPRRLLAAVQSVDGPRAVVVDPVERRVVRSSRLSGSPWLSGRTRDELVLLLRTSGPLAPARLAIVGADGEVREVVVERVLAGTVVPDQQGSRASTNRPGLAVDPDGRRAYLVPADGPAAEIDLATLAVRYHELDRPSLLGRFLRWLVPQAQAKILEGPVREARWLGNGTIAVSGVDYSAARTASGAESMSAAPAGLTLLDTRSWTRRTLDREASGLALGPGVVVAQGGRWETGRDRGFGPGLRAFDLEGRERWRLHPGEYLWMDPAGPLGYAFVGDGVVEVVELGTGAVLRTLARALEHEAWPQLLAEQSSDW